MFVCSGKLLHVDLSTGSTHILSVDEETLRSYFGGSGLAARLYMDRPDLPDPLAPEAPLYIIPGLLTGTIVSCACRVLFCGRSPLTGIWNESTAGGYFGAELRFAGWDGLLLTGRAARPSVLWIEGDRAHLSPAEDLWGMETYEAAEKLRERTDPKAQTAVIGPAGEKLIPMANIMLGGEDARTAGRGGMGAIMGSKLLKGIAVRGRNKLSYAQPELLRELVKEANKALRDAYPGYTKLGTGGGIINCIKAGDLPVKNWAGGEWLEGAQKIAGAAMAERGIHKGTSYHCHACPVACTQEIRVPSGPYAGREAHAPEYETLAGFGSNCLNDDLESIITINERCNHLGIDTISASGAIAFAMEAAERGELTPAQLGGIDLRWGNAAAILELVEQIGAGTGLGALLGQGVRHTARVLGGRAWDYAPHVKGLEFAYHDPRAETGMAGSYATANRGACHLAGITYAAIWGTSIDGVYKPDPYTAHGSENKGRMAAAWQDYMSAVNAMGLCKLVSKQVITPVNTAKWVEAALGWPMSPAEINRVGERIFNVQRQINARLGVTSADDVLPARFTRDPRPDGGAAGVVPDMTVILPNYYAARGWDTSGQPTPAKLQALGLA